MILAHLIYRTTMLLKKTYTVLIMSEHSTTLARRNICIEIQNFKLPELTCSMYWLCFYY